MKKNYFYSGNTPTINGVNKQFSGIISSEGGMSPQDLYRHIIKELCKEHNIGNITLTSFNYIGGDM